ncbi:MAG TPA: SDR family oxidoreductase [Polyangiaceae bacterium]|nr:SDR family oxidoreductase [Polyangiaceae bacterium]
MKQLDPQGPPARDEAAPPPPFTADDVRRSTRLLEAIVADRGLLAAIPKEDQIALLNAAGRVASPDREAKSRLGKAMRRSEKAEQRARDRNARAATEIRTARQAPVFVAPPPRRAAALGAGVGAGALGTGERSGAAPAADEAAGAQAAAGAGAGADAGAAGGPARGAGAGPERLLELPRNCYVCKAEYRRLHFFYDALCPECAEFNYAKRFQTAKLAGKVALVTGARVKIGYQASLMLLRAGARVIATTRFPNDAARRYAREPDFEAFAGRLDVYGLDLRHAPSVELFARHLSREYDRLDILLNNAAQTVRRPPGFYRHLLEGEAPSPGELGGPIGRLLAGHGRCVASLGGGAAAGAAALATSWRGEGPGVGLRASAALSQLPYAIEPDEGEASALFPEGRLDADLQQVDLRRVNTWRLGLAEVPTAEMLEVYLVNAVAPFILCGKLKPLMLRDRAEPGHIVNVSAMEGSFSRGTKTDKHPHTNMAKAALNMMTLTSAADYARGNLFMNAVDTGWVTDEDPAEHAERKRRELDFEPPLDVVDGAARICDPIFSSALTGHFVWGKFFKDYRPTAW